MQPALHFNDLNQNIRLFKHDIRNRLSALKLNLYVLERQGHPEQHDALIAMKEELGEINTMLEELNHIAADNE